MTAAIYFHGDAYTTAGPRLMGRNAAGESFLRGFARHAVTDSFWAHVPSNDATEAFATVMRAAGRAEPIRTVSHATNARLKEPGALYYPALNIGEIARERSLTGDAAWSLCGVTHTTASARAMDGIADLAVAPVQPWDALICTSAAVRANVDMVLAAEEARLADRLGTTRVVRPQLPVIPLGIHCDDFAFSGADRAAARAALGVDEHAMVVLFTGRLSFHAKAHPAAMYAAIEAATASLPPGGRAVLVECGWFPNDAIQRMFEAATAALCPSVEVKRLDGREAAARRTAWAGADIFCSLADNVQETFGLTPIEAKAAGLPVVVSDWDGYRCTVRDGVDGFRVPTLMPEDGLGADLAARHALGLDTYDRYCGYTAAFVDVNLTAATEAFARLFASAELRAGMGAAGRAHARAAFDWATIIPRYEALWAELAAIRASAATARNGGWPARLDPFAAFASYPTRRLTRATIVTLADPDVAAARVRLQRMITLEMIHYAASVLPSSREVEAMLAAAADGPCRADAIVATIPRERQGFAFRGIAWLAKIGVFRLA